MKIKELKKKQGHIKQIIEKILKAQRQIVEKKPSEHQPKIHFDVNSKWHIKDVDMTFTGKFGHERI